MKSLLAGLLLAISARAEAPVKFEEIFSLVRSNLIGMSEVDLNSAAAQGFVEKLKGKVELAEAAAATTGAILAKTNAFEDAFAYIRIERVATGIGSQITEAVKAAKKLKGVVLDLRFAKGDDYNGVVEAANAFINAEKPVLKWGEHTGKTSPRSDVIEAPLVVLINGQTIGAAEALAAVIRDQQLALLIGNRTAGQALVFDVFPLSSGQKLKIARGKVELPDGKLVGPEGLLPDVTVPCDESNERSWLDNPYLVIAKATSPAGSAPFLTSVTNRPSRRPNGAEIARRHRENPDDERGETPRSPLPAPSIVQDPVLARALDTLKGLAVLRSRDGLTK